MSLQGDSRYIQKQYPDHSTFESESMANQYYNSSTPLKKEYNDIDHSWLYKESIEKQTPEPITHQFDNQGDIELHSLRRYFKSQNLTCNRNHQVAGESDSMLKYTCFENEIMSFKERKTKKIKKQLRKTDNGNWDCRSMRFSKWEQKDNESCEEYDDLDLRSNFAELGEDFDAPFFMSDNEDRSSENPQKEES